MIYTVECNFTNSASEAEWNNFYTLEKLPALISVSGFLTSQRFKALSTGHPLYLAIHSIENINILHGEEYRQKVVVIFHTGSSILLTGAEIFMKV